MTTMMIIVIIIIIIIVIVIVLTAIHAFASRLLPLPTHLAPCPSPLPPLAGVSAA